MQGNAPPGFVPLPSLGDSGFNSLCGPLWVRAEDGKLVGGFRVEQRHCNPLGNCHGGMLATFCDVHLCVAAQFESDIAALVLPTISLSVDYLAPTPLGAWVEARVDILKVTRGMLFASETMFADGAPVAHARGIYKIASGAPEIGTGAGLLGYLKG